MKLKNFFASQWGIIGIGVIIATHNSMKKNGAALVIANASENIIKLFKSMRLDQHLTLDS